MMETKKIYDEDSYIKEFDATVISSEKEGKYFKTVLDRTAFFPEAMGPVTQRINLLTEFWGTQRESCATEIGLSLCEEFTPGALRGCPPLEGVAEDAVAAGARGRLSPPKILSVFICIICG